MEIEKLNLRRSFMNDFNEYLKAYLINFLMDRFQCYLSQQHTKIIE